MKAWPGPPMTNLASAMAGGDQKYGNFSNKKTWKITIDSEFSHEKV
jgi:hypothetical protein